MAFTEWEQKRCERDLKKFMAHRRPTLHVRPRLDLGFRIHGRSVEIFEMRPDWKEVGEAIETPVAIATFVRNTSTWKLYWMRGDMKWHGYPPNPVLRDFSQAPAVVDRDEFRCFFG
ncbi:MAG: DUF3024 domain-containing protein [Burkholderiales bacterium]